MTPDFVAWLREELEKIHEKLDVLQAIQGEIRTTQAELAKDIVHHIRRTDDLQTIVVALDAKVDVVESWVERAKGIAWFLGVAGGAVGVMATVVALLGN